MTYIDDMIALGMVGTKGIVGAVEAVDGMVEAEATK